MVLRIVEGGGGENRLIDLLGFAAGKKEFVNHSQSILKLGNVWVFVQLIHRQKMTKKSAVQTPKHCLT